MVGTDRPGVAASPAGGSGSDAAGDRGRRVAAYPRLARHRLNVAGHRVGVAVGGQGVPLVLASGLLLTDRLYLQTLSRLAACGFRVVAVDVAGSGISDDGKGLDEYGRLLGRVLDTLEVERAVLAGHSLGGRLVTELAALRPERVVALLLVDASVGAPWDMLVRLVGYAPPSVGVLGALLLADTLGTVPFARDLGQAAKLSRLAVPVMLGHLGAPWRLLGPACPPCTPRPAPRCWTGWGRPVSRWWSSTATTTWWCRWPRPVTRPGARPGSWSWSTGRPTPSCSRTPRPCPRSCASCWTGAWARPGPGPWPPPGWARTPRWPRSTTPSPPPARGCACSARRGPTPGPSRPPARPTTPGPGRRPRPPHPRPRPDPRSAPRPAQRAPGADPGPHPRRPVRHRLPLRRRQPARRDQAAVQLPDHRPVQRPRLVLDAGPGQHRPDPGVELPAGGQVVVELGQLAGRDRLGDLDRDRGGGRDRPRPATAAAVADQRPVALHGHGRPLVGQGVGRAGDQHRLQPGGVQGEEPQPLAPVGADHVGADVGLGEAREPGRRRRQRRAQVPEHEPGQPDPGPGHRARARPARAAAPPPPPGT